VSRIGELGLITAGRLVGMPPVPEIPVGRVVDLAGRGSTYVVDTGPVSSARGGAAPVVFLLHALACTGLLTWYPCLDALRRRYRLVIFDQRGHGQGIRSARFDLDDCADDVAAVADSLDVATFVAAGYSMGSLVAQNVWLRHRDRVDGLVLGASTTHFATTPRRQRTVTAELRSRRSTSPSTTGGPGASSGRPPRPRSRRRARSSPASTRAAGSTTSTSRLRSWSPPATG
jgi:pimeloyl-ACP methyl ester carboxylesterase